MPRGVKAEPSAPVQIDDPSKGDISKGAKLPKAKVPALAPAKPSFKKKEANKDFQRASLIGEDGGLDFAELEKKRKELFDQLRKCEGQVSPYNGVLCGVSQ